jgi:phosphoglycolate phosphatase
MANLIFDFDGTLADTFPAIIDVAYRLSPRTRRLPPDAIDELRRLPLLTAMRRLGIPIQHMPLLILLLRKRLTSRMAGVPAYEGIADMLKALKGANHQLFVLTSNYKENVLIFLNHNKLKKYITDIETVYYANTWSKTRALKRLIKLHSLKPEDSYHVGNEALDVRSADRVDMRSVAVTWGGYDDQALKATKPFAIIDKPKDLVRLLANKR